MRQYSTELGLSVSTVNAVQQDKNGYLWVGTLNGLDVFDGKEFKTFNKFNGLPNSVINDLQMHNDTLWIATGGGACYYDGEKFETINSSLGDDFIDVLITENGDKYFLKYKNAMLYQLVSDTLKPMMKLQLDVYDTLRTKMKLEHNKFDRYQSYTFQVDAGNNVSRLKSEEIFNEDSTINYIHPTASGVLIAKERKLFRKSGEDLILIRDSINVRGIYPYTHNQYLILTQQNLLILSSNDTVDSVNFNDTENTLAQVNHVFVDSELNIWLSTSVRGIIELSKSKFLNYSRATGLRGDAIFSIGKNSDNNYCIGSMDDRPGIDMLLDNKVINYSYDNVIDSSYVIELLVDSEGNEWFATFGNGLIKKTDEEIHVFAEKSGLVSNMILDVEEDDSGNIWVANGNGVSIIDGGNITRITLGDDDYWRQLVNVVEHIGGDSILVSGSTYGTKLFVDKVLQKNLKLREFDEMHIMEITKDKHDNIWFATFGDGLIKLDPQFNVTHFNSTSGLASDIVYFIEMISDSIFVLGTEKGISQVRFVADTIAYVDNYSANDGIIGTETNQRASYMDEEGNIWFGTIKGLCKYDPKEKQKTLLYSPILTSFKNYYSSDQVLKNNPSWGSITDGIELAYEINDLTFTFQSVTMQDPNKVKYSHRLIGFSDLWSVSSMDNHASYLDLPPGDYEFQVRSKLGKNWSPKTLSYKFNIIPPFYLTWYFFVFVAMLIVFIFWSAHRIHVNYKVSLERYKLEEYKKVKNEMARDFHDELGNKLAGIIAYSSYLSANFNTLNGKTLSVIDKITISAQDLFQGTKDFIWTMHSESNSVKEVMSYLNSFGHELFDDINIKFQLKDETLSKKEMPAGYNRQIILILKEGMTNIVKHAKAKNVLLEVITTDFLIFKLLDDGQGISSQQDAEGVGIESMKKRAKKMNAQFDLNSSEH